VKEPAQPPGRILVVDDSRLIRRWVGDVLRGVGYEVDEAADGRGAVRLLESEAYDAIVTDLHMPELDGFGLLEIVRRRQWDSEVVILTGSHAQDIGAAVRALRLGARDYLTKPLAGPEPLVISVERAVEARRQRQALRAAEERYRQLFDRVPIGLCRTTPAGQILDANQALVHMLGYGSREELLAVNADTLYVEPEAHRRWSDALARQDLVEDYEAQLRRRDGRIIWVAHSARCARDVAGAISHYECSVQDISERKQVEGEAREAQKMEALGRLAGGVAHDFNNLLGVVMGALEFASSRAEPGSRISHDIERARGGAERAATLTKQLLAFSRKQVLQPRLVDLNTLIGGMKELLRSLLGSSISLRLDLGPGLGPIMGDPGQIQQVLVNLVVNARDAMEAGGTLTIETRNADLDAERAGRAPQGQPGPYAMFAVTDTGVGIDEKTRARIFDPFFTTKEPGKGTGLGLSIVYGIVKQGGGHVWVYSEVGVGSTFKVYLPRVQGRPATARPLAATRRGQGETILVVEDDTALREVVSRDLRENGYSVIEAGCAQEALALSAGHAGRIDLLLTDIVMPGMLGTTLAEEIRLARAGIKTLFISGYPDGALTQNGLIARDAFFMEKPFSHDALLCKVQEILFRGRAA
jgi:PAS domain S-box-containing protein